LFEVSNREKSLRGYAALSRYSGILRKTFFGQMLATAFDGKSTGKRKRGELDADDERRRLDARRRLRSLVVRLALAAGLYSLPLTEPRLASSRPLRVTALSQERRQLVG
jgi:hypothetical protein